MLAMECVCMSFNEWKRHVCVCSSRRRICVKEERGRLNSSPARDELASSSHSSWQFGWVSCAGWRGSIWVQVYVSCVSLFILSSQIPCGEKKELSEELDWKKRQKTKWISQSKHQDEAESNETNLVKKTEEIEFYSKELEIKKSV